MVAGLITDEGIVCIGDGRSTDLKGAHLSDKEVKLFRLSSHCVCMPANGLPQNIDTVMHTLQAIFKNHNFVYVDDIARKIIDFCKISFQTDKYKPEDMPTFTLVGYVRDGQPKLYDVRYHDNQWGIFEPSHPFMLNGYTRQDAIDILLDGYEQSRHSLQKASILALKAMRVAMENNPQHVGGQISLWQLLPAGSMFVLSNNEIVSLQSRIV